MPNDHHKLISLQGSPSRIRYSVIVINILKTIHKKNKFDELIANDKLMFVSVSGGFAPVFVIALFKKIIIIFFFMRY